MIRRGPEAWTSSLRVLKTNCPTLAIREMPKERLDEEVARVIEGTRLMNLERIAIDRNLMSLLFWGKPLKAKIKAVVAESQAPSHVEIASLHVLLFSPPAVSKARDIDIVIFSEEKK